VALEHPEYRADYTLRPHRHVVLESVFNMGEKIFLVPLLAKPGERNHRRAVPFGAEQGEVLSK
jgi:hypothetical protein